MGRCFGGRALEGELQALEAELHEYFGALAEIDMGLNTKPVPKPQMLKSLERCEMFSSLPESGGVDDQSYIWLQGVVVCHRVRDLRELIRKRNEQLNTT